MKCLIALILLSWSCWCHCEPFDGWTQEQQAWGAVAGGLMLADWATTRYGTRHWDDGYYELNPFLGRYPSTSRLDLHFLIAIPATYFVADALPEYRTMILKAVTAMELIAVGNNLSIGLKLSF